jgi:hypothetical protein
MMNKEQKNKLAQILKELVEAKTELDAKVTEITTTLVSAGETVDEIKEDTQDHFDALSEKAQEGEKGTELEADINSLDTIVDKIDSVKSELDDTGPLDDIIDQLKSLAEE